MEEAEIKAGGESPARASAGDVQPTPNDTSSSSAELANKVGTHDDCCIIGTGNRHGSDEHWSRRKLSLRKPLQVQSFLDGRPC